MPSTSPPLGVVFVVMVGGVAIAVTGHLLGRRAMIVVGIAVLLAATALLFGTAFSSWDRVGRPPSPVGPG